MADIHDAVRDKCGAIAASLGTDACCAPAGCGDPIASTLSDCINACIRARKPDVQACCGPDCCGPDCCRR